LAANTSTCTPTRGPSDGWHAPATGPLAGSVKRGPVPIGRASLSSARGIDAVAGGRAGGCGDAQADTAAAAIGRTAMRTARATRAASPGTDRSYEPAGRAVGHCAVARRERRSSAGSAEVGAARWARSMSAASRLWCAEWPAKGEVQFGELLIPALVPVGPLPQRFLVPHDSVATMDQVARSTAVRPRP
jgi:hypothetical protein